VASGGHAKRREPLCSANMSEMVVSADEAEQGGGPTFRSPALIVYHLFEEPSYFESWGVSGKPFLLAASIISLVLNILIAVSTVAFCFETMQDYSPDPHRNPCPQQRGDDWCYEDWEDIWWVTEVVCVVLFTADLLVRGLGAAFANKGGAFLNDAMNYIDFLAIFPFYVRLVFEDFFDLRFLRVVRLARILRSLKSARYGSLGSVVVDIVKNSVGALFIPVYFMVLALIVFSSIMFYIEQTTEMKCVRGDGTYVQPWDTQNTTPGNEGCVTSTGYGCECSGTLVYLTYDGAEWSDEMYESIPDSFWWCIVTFTTVGYGDKYPRTTWGRIVCAVTMFCGIFFLAMPLTIVGSSFSDAWDTLQSKKLAAAAHDRQKDRTWIPNKEKVEELKADIKAHLLRAKALTEELSADAQTEGAGEDIGAAWEKNIEMLSDADANFDSVMLLYRDEDASEEEADADDDDDSDDES
jgi:hypothetical protein